MKTRTLPMLLVAMLMIAFVAAPALAQEKMTYEEYQTALANWEQQLQEAQTSIEQEDATQDSLQGVIGELDAEISSEWQAIYEMLGLTEEQVQAFRDELAAVESDIARFERMNAEEIYQNREELDAIDARLGELEGQVAALLSEFKDKIEGLKGRVQAIRDRMAPPPVITYSVVRGDYLWKIAAKEEHYGDGMKWMRIYSVNHEKIDNPDLIFPNQVFDIPLDVEAGQYLVMKGDFLYGIAESQMGDPFKWRDLYEANKGFVNDPNTIYPDMILDVPGR